MIYSYVGFQNSPQLASSDPSAQSGSSSQTQSLEMQCMEALHWNWSGEQVLSAVIKDGIGCLCVYACIITLADT